MPVVDLCCPDLDNIGPVCGKPAKAGIQLVMAITCGSNVDTFPTPVRNVYPTKPVLKTDKKWNTIVFSKEDLSAPVSKMTFDGKNETKMAVFVPKIDANKSFTLSEWVGEGKIIVFQDHDEQTRVLGEVETKWVRQINGCKISCDESYQGKNGYKLDITFEDGNGFPMYLDPTAATAMKSDFKV
jgi:hypothetical protein